MFSSPYNINMSVRTNTEWHCTNCGELQYKPYWQAVTRKFCSDKCRADHFKSIDPDYYKKIGAKADKDKISATLKLKQIKPPSRLGATATKKTKKKMSDSLKLAWATGVKKAPTKVVITSEGRKRKIEATQKMRRELAKKGRLTSLEKIIDDYLVVNSIEHINEYPVGDKVVDFYLPKLGTFIEADGDYWHQDKDKDAERDKYIKSIFPEIELVRCNEASIKSGMWVNLIKWRAV